MSDLPVLPPIESTVLGTPSPQPLNTLEIEHCGGDPLKFLSKIMDHPKADIRMRLEAAKILMPFKYAKLGETGKKEAQNGKAKETAGKGKFGSLPAPGAAATVN